ncbi:DUF1572 domain-containing protein [Stieleria sp. TO1_6]|uniref:DUF1572 family protein n=1 Tax=Stieleria tagensis TaxID=2956795 RepID=UPI00209A6996|nr:DUF1572 family protein [Stieleria tagensis]MCO8121889.1 DUF1572 domain-containing protein [Stieleria tagensis]
MFPEFVFPEFEMFGRNSILDTVNWLKMEMCGLTTWLDAMRETVGSYRRVIDATIAQLTDAELHARPAQDFNSVAIILRHLGGNLQSRWTVIIGSP